MNLIDLLKQTATSGRIKTDYTVGGKSTGVPLDVRLSLDPDFRKTVLISVAMLSAGIAVGAAVGAAVKKSHS